MELMPYVNKWGLTVPGDRLGTGMKKNVLWVTESTTKNPRTGFSWGKARLSKGHLGSKNAKTRELDRKVEIKERCNIGKSEEPSEKNIGLGRLMEMEPGGTSPRQRMERKLIVDHPPEGCGPLLRILLWGTVLLMRVCR